MSVDVNHLWGGRLEAIDFDPITHDLVLNVRVTNQGNDSMFVVRCREVAEMRFSNRVPLPWTYAEVTEAHASVDHASSSWLLELMLWDEGCTLEVRCTGLEAGDRR